jgi:hypothetical protein
MGQLVAGLQGRADQETPVDKAQALLYRAFGEQRRVQLANEVLETRPDCAGASVLLPEHAAGRPEALRRQRFPGAGCGGYPSRNRKERQGTRRKVPVPSAFAVPTPDCAVCPGSYRYNDPSKKGEGRTSEEKSMPTTAEAIRAAVGQRFAQVARSPGQERKFQVGPESAKELGYEPRVRRSAA